MSGDEEILETLKINGDTAPAGPNAYVSKLIGLLLSEINIQGGKWSQLFNLWGERTAVVLGTTAVKNNRGNVRSAFKKKTMTWSTFVRILQIINANDEYSEIRFDITLTEANTGKNIKVGLDLYNSKDAVMVDSLNVTKPDRLNAKPLKPGYAPVNGEHYRLLGFDNKDFEGTVAKFTSISSKLLPSSYFDECTTIGTYIVDRNGDLSKDWTLYAKKPGESND